jgi:hypothetical protein
MPLETAGIIGALGGIKDIIKDAAFGKKTLEIILVQGTPCTPDIEKYSHESRKQFCNFCFYFSWHGSDIAILGCQIGHPR